VSRTLAVVRRPAAADLPGRPADVEPQRAFDIGGLGRICFGFRTTPAGSEWVGWGPVPTVALLDPRRPLPAAKPLGLGSGLALRAAGAEGWVDKPGRAGLRGALRVGRSSARIRATLGPRRWWLGAHRLMSAKVTHDDGGSVVVERLTGLRWENGDELDLAVAALLLVAVDRNSYLILGSS